MSLRRLLLIPLGAGALLAVAGMAFIPIASGSREQVFEIPKGTWSSRMSGQNVEILPSSIRLTLGLRDVLVLRNLDEVPQTFGPTLMMPGQSFRLPFERAAEYQFACSAHASGQMSIIVEPNPDTPWARVVWRTRAVAHTLMNRVTSFR